MSAWNISNAEKLVFLIVLIAGSVGAGYLARRAGLRDSAARVLMYFVITVPYAVVGLLALWGLDLRARYAALPLIGLAIMAGGVGGAMLLAPVLKLARPTAGAFVLVAGASNLGFTMGGFVNYALFGQQGLALAAMFTMYWDFGMVLLLYPVARHYGQSERQPAWKLIAANFGDVRSLPFYATAAGLALNLLGVPRPAAVVQPIVGQLAVLDILILLGAVIAFFVTGLRLHLAGLGRHVRLYAAVAGIKFLLAPAAAAVLLAAMRLVGLGLDAPAWKVVMVQASTPAAIYAVVISNLFRLDDRLASILFVVNTAFYLAVILPIVVAVMS